MTTTSWLNLSLFIHLDLSLSISSLSIHLYMHIHMKYMGELARGRAFGEMTTGSPVAVQPLSLSSMYLSLSLYPYLDTYLTCANSRAAVSSVRLSQQITTTSWLSPAATALPSVALSQELRKTHSRKEPPPVFTREHPPAPPPVFTRGAVPLVIKCVWVGRLHGEYAERRKKYAYSIPI
jgi:hypothetical protein